MSVFLLKERFHKSDILALTTIACGCTLFMIAAKNSKHKLTNDELMELYLRPFSIIYIAAALAAIFFGYRKEIKIVGELKEYNSSVNSALHHD